MAQDRQYTGIESQWPANGWIKILVLYIGYDDKRGKTKWGMHEYHLGDDENEKEGELVVRKVFYQTEKLKERLISKEKYFNLMLNLCSFNFFKLHPLCSIWSQS